MDETETGARTIGTAAGEKARHEVTILDQTYTVLSDAPADRVKEIAEFLDSRLREVLTGGRSLSTLRGAILAALNITEDYFRAEDRARAIEATIERQTQDLIKLLDEKGL